MFVGIAHVVLRIPGARSLKDRRRAVSSYKDRLRVRLSVSVAEVGETENHRAARLGIALVAREAREAEELLDRAVSIAHQISDALVLDASRRVLPWRAEWSAASSDPMAPFGEDLQGSESWHPDSPDDDADDWDDDDGDWDDADDWDADEGDDS